MDAFVQCSLLPAPPLSFHGIPDHHFEGEGNADMEIDEVATESDDSNSDTDYMSDSNDMVMKE